MVRWLGKPVPATPDAEIVFPGHCTYETPKLDCGTKGLVGKISFKGLGKKQSATVVRIIRRDNTIENYTLTSTQPSIAIIKGNIGWIQACLTYLPLGIEHILLGIDHLLFVLGLICAIGALTLKPTGFLQHWANPSPPGKAR
ncbi:MAG: HupE/UreJ family protein [Desulfobacteraceae bacterium]|jgi:hypothetical protein